MYQRSTTASRRLAQRMLDASRFVHVSQWFKPHTIEHKDESGTVTHVTTVHVPQHGVTLPNSKGEPTFVPRGKTYNVGRNWRKRLCRAAGLNHVHMERHHGLKEGRRTFYPACVGA